MTQKLSYTSQFEGWECAQRPPGQHMAYLAQEAAREIEHTMARGTPPGMSRWGDKQRYELVVTLREVPAVQAGSKVPGAGARSGKTRTAAEASIMHAFGAFDEADHEILGSLHPNCNEALKGAPKCECGAAATGEPHARWCPLFES
ncbi:MAG: hypothetical protein V3S01_07090 [Dehalococcoidia bacterium]